MSVELRLPNIKGDTPEAQLGHLKSYLYQLVEQLNWALNLTGGEDAVVDETKTPAQIEEEERKTFNSIKSLIIKSADIVDAYTEEMTKVFDGRYVAESDFGTFTEETNAAIHQNSTAIDQVYTNVQTIEGTVDGIGDEMQNVLAHIRTGLLYYDDKGIPVYGLEIGQRNTVDNNETFRKYARFVSNRLSFFDQNDTEVAYISDYKLYITSAQVITGLTVGRYYMDTSDGLAFKWV